MPPTKVFLCLIGLIILVTDAAEIQEVGATLNPRFVEPINNVTVDVGEDATFTCVVSQIQGYEVVWVKADTNTILASDTRVITHNPWISVSHDRSRLRWMLHITQAELEDTGPYKCLYRVDHYSTDPMKSQMGFLEVVIPPDFAEEIGEVGAGQQFVFDTHRMYHIGNAPFYTPYTGGDPGCCQKCREANDPSRWGRTDLYNFKFDLKYNFNRCMCFAGPKRWTNDWANLRSKKGGPIIGYCGNNSTFLDQVDGTFGEDRAFIPQSVEEIRLGLFVRYVKSSEECCKKCSDEAPGSQMFEFVRRLLKTTPDANLYNYCRCYKAIPGKQPQTYGEGSYNGICANE